MTKKRTILVLGDLTRAGVEPVLDVLMDQLSKIAGVNFVDLSTSRLEGRCEGDLVIVLGGDGTILSVARCLGNHQVPILGINLGKLGYLAEFSPEDVERLVEDIREKRLHISRRTMLATRIRGNGEEFSTPAVNDVVVQAGPPFRMIELKIQVDGQELTTIEGDGVIVASASGSTGHNISAGGPVVDPSVPAVVLTPLNAHSLTHRPLVLSCEAEICITASRVNPGSTVIIDGQVTRPLGSQAQIRVGPFPHPFLLVQNRIHTRWHTLQTKLNWGLGPNYNI